MTDVEFFLKARRESRKKQVAEIKAHLEEADKHLQRALAITSNLAFGSTAMVCGLSLYKKVVAAHLKVRDLINEKCPF